MADKIEIRRVTVIAETSLERKLLETFLKLGARGYTCVYCFGKGQHEVVEDPYTGRSSVRIEVLARLEVAEAILAHIHKTEFENFPIIGFMDSVQVYANDRFF